MVEQVERAWELIYSQYASQVRQWGKLHPHFIAEYSGPSAPRPQFEKISGRRCLKIGADLVYLINGSNTPDDCQHDNFLWSNLAKLWRCRVQMV